MPPTTEQIIQRLGKLQSILLQSGIQQTNQPLYQVINQLIQAVRDSNTGVIEITGGGGGGGPLADQHYLTSQNDLVTLPNSRQLLAGDNVTFDDSVFGERTVDVPLAQTFLTVANETATLANSRRVLAGTGISFDDSVANVRTINATVPDREWSVLTNGDAINPELIFAGGDVIMTHVP